MRTAEQIKTEALSRYNPNTKTTGMLTRQDVVDFLEQVSPDKEKEDELMAFCDELPFMTAEDKQKLHKDLKSYGI